MKTASRAPVNDHSARIKMPSSLWRAVTVAALERLEPNAAFVRRAILRELARTGRPAERPKTAPRPPHAEIVSGGPEP